MTYVAQAAVCSQIQIQNKLIEWAERTIVEC